MRMADLADAVKRSVTARQVAEMLGLHPNNAGFCKCPIHGEKTGSMKLYPGQRGWYCFGCHQGGSVIDLVMACNGVDMAEAIRTLNDEFNLGLPVNGEATREQQEEAKRRAAEREQKKKELEAAKRAIDEAYERYCEVGYRIGQYELDKVQYAPKPDAEELDPRYVKAMMELPALKEEAERFALVCIGKEGTY